MGWSSCPTITKVSAGVAMAGPSQLHISAESDLCQLPGCMLVPEQSRSYCARFQLDPLHASRAVAWKLASPWLE